MQSSLGDGHEGCLIQVSEYSRDWDHFRLSRGIRVYLALLESYVGNPPFQVYGHIVFGPQLFRPECHPDTYFQRASH